LLERSGFTDLHPQATIQRVTATEGGYALEVGLATCNAEVGVDIEEHADRIVLHPKRHDRHLWVTGSDDCQDIVRVELKSPLGSREVVDSSGDELLVERG
jgi:hypothetical protein